MVKRVVQLIIACVAFMVPASNALAAVVATVDRTDVEINESFTLKVLVDTDVDVEPDASALETDFIVGQRSQLSNTTIKYGQISRSRTWTYVLMPRRDGDLVIPPVIVGGWYDGDQSQSGNEGADGEANSESQDGDSSRSEEEMNQEDLEAIQKELERAAQEAAQQQGEPEDQQGKSSADAMAQRRAQEQQQAMEQWLRRIPNDPGGLLRTKFHNQYLRYGRDQDGNNLWPDDEIQPW